MRTSRHTREIPIRILIGRISYAATRLDIPSMPEGEWLAMFDEPTGDPKGVYYTRGEVVRVTTDAEGVPHYYRILDANEIEKDGRKQ